jgi:hypothetical protein
MGNILEEKGFKPNVRIERITPKMAKEYLEHNLKNRPCSERVVNDYVNRMKAGEWMLSPDAIAFDYNGNLINGQHRLRAIVKSGVECDFYVGRNCQPAVFVVTDEGKKRSAGDTLAIHGATCAARTSSIVKAVLALRSRRSLNNGTNIYASNNSVLKEFNSNPALYEEVGRKGDKLYRAMRLMKLSYYAAYIYYLFNDMAYPESVIMSFFESLTDIEPTNNETIRTLRRALLDDMQSPNHKMTPKRKEKLIMKAWNAYISGKSIQRLSWNPDTEADLWFTDSH